MLRNKISVILSVLMISISCYSFSQTTDYVFNKVVIDAGHGGKDPGATYGGTFEKDITLDVALKTGELIKNNIPEVSVIYTRNKDVFVPLNDRAIIANKSKADLFISIHVNSCSKNEITGTETFILGLRRSQKNLEVTMMENSVILLEDDYSTKYEGFDPSQAESYIMFEMMQNEYLEQSMLFAEKVQKNIISSTGRKDRGVKQDCFLVLVKPAMPSVLVEIGFMSNAGEREYLGAEKVKKLMAQSISSAVNEYKQRFNERNSPTITLNNKTNSKDNEKISRGVKDTINTNVIKDTITNPLNQPYISQEIIKEDSINDITGLKGIWFGVQIMAVTEKYPYYHPIFKNQTSLYYFYENGYHKYFTGLSQDSGTALKANNQAKSLFPGSFPVAFIDGEKMPFSKAQQK